MNRKILFEKWKDPYGRNEDDFKDFGYDADEDELEAIHNMEEAEQFIPRIPTKGLLMTQLGAMPIVEWTNPSKIFNFWTGHTDFIITAELAKIIEESKGVEVFNVFTPYRFRIAVGKLFKDGEVMNDILNNVNSQKIIMPTGNNLKDILSDLNG